MAAERVSSESITKPRSPNYPSMNLSTAIERVRMVYLESHDHLIRATDAILAMGYSERSSGGIQALATLIAFGLLENHGRGDDRKVKVSFEAMLMMNEHDSARGVKAIADAAKRPAAHALLWEKFGPRLPGDSVMRSFLIVDQKFMPDGAEQLVKEYRETFSFAHLDLSPDAPQNSEVKPNDQPPVVIPPEQTNRVNPKVLPVTDSPDTKQDVFAVTNGHVVVSWPADLRGPDILDIEEYWPILLRKIKRALQADDPTETPEHPANARHQ